MLDALRKLIPLDSPIRVVYHKLRAVIAAFAYGFPANGMVVVGVTGTDGKTTTATMIAKILEDAGHTVGLLSTVAISIAGQREVNDRKMTSFDPFTMNRYLRKMAKAGCGYVVLETSSHAIFYDRIWGVNFDVAALTHISSDHLDLHRTLENYVRTKRRLFERINGSPRKPGVAKVIVLNQDDTYFAEFDELTADKKLTYGVQTAAQVRGIVREAAPTYTRFSVEVANENQGVLLSFGGRFHVSNALAAISVGLSQGVTLQQCAQSLEFFAGVPGRMEAVKNAAGYNVIVDYAHTENGLLQVLKSARESNPGHAITLVFGAPGERDEAKRPKMGSIAAGIADYVILTDDDPGAEPSNRILSQVEQGIGRQEGEKYWVIPDRRSAIRTALYLSDRSGTILITGKGCEPVQLTNAGRIPWSDRAVVEEILHELEETPTEAYPVSIRP